MDNLPEELVEHIYSFLHTNECFIQNGNNEQMIMLKKTCRKINESFICNYKILKINDDKICLCGFHDRLLLDNINIIFNQLKKHYNYFFVEIFIENDEKISIPLSLLHLGPYRSIMSDEVVFFPHLSPFFDRKQIDHLRARFIRKIFRSLAIPYYQYQISNVNTKELIENHSNIIDEIINFSKI
jgi:hypothetical protein